MRITLTTLGALSALTCGLAVAQTSPSTSHNPAIAAPSDTNKPGAPAAGANSFTESQAKSRLEKDGYSNVSGLVKDENGLWRGSASKAGQTVSVAVDYQGNIVTR